MQLTIWILHFAIANNFDNTSPRLCGSSGVGSRIQLSTVSVLVVIY